MPGNFPAGQFLRKADKSFGVYYSLISMTATVYPTVAYVHVGEEFAYSLLLKTFMQTSLLFLALLLLLASPLLLGVPAIAGISALDNFSDILCGGIYCVPVIADVPTIAIIRDLFLLLSWNFKTIYGS
jgi:hypothetical protein